MRAGFDFHEITACLEVGNNLLSCLKTVKPPVFAAVFVYLCVLVKDGYHFEIVTLAHLEVVRVVAGRYLYAARAEFAVDIFVGDDRYLSAHEREDGKFADERSESLILGMNGDGSVSEHCLGARRCHGDIFAVASLDGIADMPECALFILVLDLGIRESRGAVRAVVYDAQSAVDKPFIVERNEVFLYSGAERIVHCEAQAAPVAGGAEGFELVDDAVAVFLFPFPDKLGKFLSAEVIAGEPLFLAEVFLDLYLRGDAGMVCAGNPERAVALHALEADERILKSLIERMTHMKLPRYIGRRDNDGEGLFFLVSRGCEISALAPALIERTFKRRGIVCFVKFLCHIRIPCPFLFLCSNV